MDKKLIEKIQTLRGSGKSYGDIAKELLITKSQACYFSKIDIQKYDEKKASYDKYINSVCELAKRCSNINQILRILGKGNSTEYYRLITKILKDNNIDTSHFVSGQSTREHTNIGLETKDYLVSGSTIGSSQLRNKIIKDSIKEYKCERCGRTEWEGKPIPLQLHHINGDKTDNRIENLQLLCPNCHAFTDNYCGRKLKKGPNRCQICGKIINRESKYCVACYNEHVKDNFRGETFKNKNNQEIKYPSKDELINDFKEFGSFRGISKKYGLSDKAIVKWFVKYKLPSKSPEMRKLIKNMFGDVKWAFTKGNGEFLREYQKNNFRKVDLLDEDGNVKKTYSSVKELVDDGLRPKNVYNVCKGKAKTHHKMVFRFTKMPSN